MAAGRLPLDAALRALAIVYAANFAGSVLLACAVFVAGVHDAGDGSVGRAALDIGATKLAKSSAATLVSGVLANMLVCLAVWMAYGAETVTGKIAGLALPIAAFVAAGLEHSVANMFLLPSALLVQTTMDAAPLSAAAAAGNLILSTIGNVIGGGLVAIAYGSVHGMTRR